MDENEKMNFKLDLFNFLNNNTNENDEFIVIYHNKKSGETIGGITPDYKYLISILTDLNELEHKEQLRGFIMNSAVNIITEYPKDYFKIMKNFIKNFKQYKNG